MMLHLHVPGGQPLELQQNEHHKHPLCRVLICAFLMPYLLFLMGLSRSAQKSHHHVHAIGKPAAAYCSHSDSYPDSLQAAVGAGVEDVREVRQRLVAIEAGIVKSQRQEDKRGVDLLHRLSESEVSAATWFQLVCTEHTACVAAWA